MLKAKDNLRETLALTGQGPSYFIHKAGISKDTWRNMTKGQLVFPHTAARLSNVYADLTGEQQRRALHLLFDDVGQRPYSGRKREQEQSND